MERDFLGLGGKDETRPICCNDSAFLASSLVQRPNQKNMSNLQQFMSFKAVAQENKFDKNVFSRYTNSGFHPLHSMGYVDATHRLSPVLLSQKNFSMDGRGTHPFPMPVCRSMISDSNGNTTIQHCDPNLSGNTRMLPMVSNQSIPMSQMKFSKSHASGSMHGSSAMMPQKQQQPSGEGSWIAAPPVSRSTDAAFPSRISTIPIPATAQLTIFYGGAVNVYDNVPIEKAQAIMSFASSSSTTSSCSGEPRKQAPSPPLISGKMVEVESTNMNTIHQHTGAASPCSAFSSPISVASHSGSGSSSHDDRERQKRDKLDPVAKSEAAEPLQTTALLGVERIPDNTLRVRAVPMARKASLARFLEKRKERITNATPYSTQKAIECGSGHNRNHSPSKPASAVGKSPPGSVEESWRVGCFKVTPTHPKTTLEMELLLPP